MSDTAEYCSEREHLDTMANDQQIHQAGSLFSKWDLVDRELREAFALADQMDDLLSLLADEAIPEAVKPIIELRGSMDQRLMALRDEINYLKILDGEER